MAFVGISAALSHPGFGAGARAFEFHGRVWWTSDVCGSAEKLVEAQASTGSTPGVYGMLGFWLRVLGIGSQREVRALGHPLLKFSSLALLPFAQCFCRGAGCEKAQADMAGLLALTGGFVILSLARFPSSCLMCPSDSRNPCISHTVSEALPCSKQYKRGPKNRGCFLLPRIRRMEPKLIWPRHFLQLRVSA